VARIPEYTLEADRAAALGEVFVPLRQRWNKPSQRATAAQKGTIAAVRQTVKL
jgi:hypothetical protein